MGVSDLQFETNAGDVVDLSSRGIQKLEPNFVCSDDTHTLILDRNQIMKLDYLERSPGLQQLSVASNRLVRMMGVCRLTELKVLNLPNNSIGYIEGLRDLPNLRWLNLCGNNIKVIEQLNNCVSLQHLDLSDNNISNIGDLTKLVELKTLLLHGNSIQTLRTVPVHLPAHISILSLAENEIRDLNEVLHLASLQELEQLSVMSNPCVMATPSLPSFDYRPYVMSWCLSLKVLDGYVVSQKEGLKAEWLYSQGKGRSYRPGQHVQLVQYLATVCPLTSSPALETAEDAKLEKILSKQRFHQRQLLQENHGSCPNISRPTQLDVEKHSPLQPAPQEGAREVKAVTTTLMPAAPLDQEKGPVLRFNTWVGSETSPLPLPVIHSPRLGEEQLRLEDMQNDEDLLDCKMLLSECTFSPCMSDQEPPPPHSDSEDETETFEPDSLALKLPPQHKQLSNSKTHHSTPVNTQKESLEEVVSCDAIRAISVAVQSTPQNEQEAFSHFQAEQKDASEIEEAVSCITLSDSAGTTNAAVKIQSWWRGHYARCYNPIASEVRSEIRLRRMQDHIVFLSEKLDRVQRQCEEERLQRLVQEDAVKFLWKQLQSLQQWKQTVEHQLTQITQPPTATPAQISTPGLCEVAPNVNSSTNNPAGTDVSFPDSGFQSTCEQHEAQEDSFLSSGTAGSLKTVRALSPVCSGNGSDSPDCSLLEQYLSSVQQREEEAEESISDRRETPDSSPSVTPTKTGHV